MIIQQQQLQWIARSLPLWHNYQHRSPYQKVYLSSPLVYRYPGNYRFTIDYMSIGVFRNIFYCNDCVINNLTFTLPSCIFLIQKLLSICHDQQSLNQHILFLPLQIFLIRHQSVFCSSFANHCVRSILLFSSACKSILINGVLWFSSDVLTLLAQWLVVVAIMLCSRTKFYPTDQKNYQYHFYPSHN